MTPDMTAPDKSPGTTERSTLLRTLRTVGAAAFGVRAGRRHEQDGAGLSPVAIIVTAVIFAIIFIGGLVTLATSIASK